MVILKFWGGIGNQLFIYGLYKELEYKGKIVRADIINLLDEIDTIGPDVYMLDKIGIKPNFAKEKDFYTIQKTVKNKFLWLKYIFKGNPKKYYDYFNSYHEKSKTFDADVFNIDNTFIFGYWQSPKYFSDVKDLIKEDIRFPEFPELTNWEKRLSAPNAVSVHLRLKDYLNPVNKGFGKVCSMIYYKNAIELICSKVENPVFYVFSDDYELAKKMISEIEFYDFIFVEKHDTIEDLYLISKCKHHIIANSSYSWWGAWLGCDNDSVVAAPEIWHMDNPGWDIYEDNWIKVKIK